MSDFNVQSPDGIASALEDKHVGRVHLQLSYDFEKLAICLSIIRLSDVPALSAKKLAVQAQLYPNHPRTIQQSDGWNKCYTFEGRIIHSFIIMYMIKIFGIVIDIMNDAMIQ